MYPVGFGLRVDYDQELIVLGFSDRHEPELVFRVIRVWHVPIEGIAEDGPRLSKADAMLPMILFGFRRVPRKSKHDWWRNTLF